MMNKMLDELNNNYKFRWNRVSNDIFHSTRGGYDNDERRIYNNNTNNWLYLFTYW